MASSIADMELVKLSKVAPKDSLEITQADISCYSTGKSGNPRLWPEVTDSNASSLIRLMRDSQDKQGIVLPEGRCEEFVDYLRKYKVRFGDDGTYTADDHTTLQPDGRAVPTVLTIRRDGVIMKSPSVASTAATISRPGYPYDIKTMARLTAEEDFGGFLGPHSYDEEY